jgi:hypothetical protein
VLRLPSPCMRGFLAPLHPHRWKPRTSLCPFSAGSPPAKAQTARRSGRSIIGTGEPDLRRCSGRQRLRRAEGQVSSGAAGAAPSCASAAVRATTSRSIRIPSASIYARVPFGESTSGPTNSRTSSSRGELTIDVGARPPTRRSASVLTGELDAEPFDGCAPGCSARSRPGTAGPACRVGAGELTLRRQPVLAERVDGRRLGSCRTAARTSRVLRISTSRSAAARCHQPRIRRSAASATSSIARLNSASFAFDGVGAADFAHD